MNNTSIKFYSLTNDEDGKIVLTPAGELQNKPERSRVLVGLLEEYETAMAEAVEIIRGF